jgi:antitoxin component YwqK of YwqJK toxin-antitoxin module
MKKVMFAAAAMVGLMLMFAPPGGSKVVTRDRNSDGRIDRRAHFQSGSLVLLEVDGNGDGVFDRRQHYERGDLVRVERDTDQDGFWETVDTYRMGRRVKQTIRNSNGSLTQVSTFDDQGRLLEIRRDRTGDEILDTVYAYRRGELCNATTDGDANGAWESLQLFANGTMREHHSDEDQDGHVERIIRTTSKGDPQESEHDLDEDGVRETFRTYSQGKVSRQETLDPRTESVKRVVLFAGGQPREQRRDTTDDGRFDSWTWFEKGRPVKQERDTNSDGNRDTVSLFDPTGNVREVRKDTNHDGHTDQVLFMAGDQVERKKLDADHDRFFETEVTFVRGTRKKMAKDRDRDGKPDLVIEYNDRGERTRLSTDRNGDNHMDTWQTYAGGQLIRLEQDEGGNGQVDLKVFYEQGEKDRLLRDQDGDGRFETVQLYRVEGWDLVIEQDRDHSGHPEARLCYEKGLLRQKEVFDRQGQVQCIEYFDDQGCLCRSREREDKGLSLTWIYDQEGRAVEARRDKDLDGKPEVFFFYQNGTLSKVEEDSNNDGRVDVWETYDQSETLVSRSRDLDFDGRPDLTKEAGNSE